jgi:hypothetical protein
MMNTTLNLSMRPTGFDEVIGLKEQVNTIRNKIAEGVPRGWLIKGPYGCGKTTLALIIAREIQGWEFSGKPQVMEINGANYRKINDMRELADKAGSYPMVGKYNVIILDEVHQLTKEAQQILLKELETPNSPTVWILATTDPDKLNQGVRDRCFTITVNGMGSEERATLVQRAAAAVEHTGDLTEFLKALDKSKIVSPRKILMAFELYHNGTPAVQAIGAMHYETLPEYYEIAIGVVFGQWEKSYQLPWLKEKDGSPKHFKAVSEQFAALDAQLKKKTKDDSEPVADTTTGDDTGDAESTAVDEEDVIDGGKPAAARAIRAIVAGMLKNQIAKADAKKLNIIKAGKAADALFILSHCTSPNPFDTGMEWAATLGGLYRVNQKMNGK